MKEKETEPLIEILKCDDYQNKKKGQAKFKGKRINQRLITLCDEENLELKIPAEKAFDFTAGLLPGFMCYGIRLKNEDYLGLLSYAYVTRQNNCVEITFPFSIDEYDLPKSDLNPFKGMAVLRKEVKKRKYKILKYLNPDGFGVVFKIPLTDNVYPHYQKHLAALEKLCRTIESDMIKRLNKKAVINSAIDGGESK